MTTAFSAFRMRVFAVIMACAFTAGFVVDATAEPVEDSRGTIERQLDAFQRDAWDEAYAFASPGVKRSFPTVESFSNMVRQGYPMVWRPQDVLFLDAEESDGRIVHRVRLVGPDGQAYIATYVLEPSETGWLIAAVFIEEEAGSA